MKITNKLGLPVGLVRAVSTEKHNAPGCISATTLIQGVKQIILTQRHWNELEDDAADRIWAVFGTAVHSLLESEGENDFTEIEMKYAVNGITITGRIDNYNLAEGLVCDYKTSSVYKIKSQDFEDWYLQGMIYAWLLIKNNLPAKKCRFIAMLKDYSYTEARRNDTYPQKPVYLYEFDITQDGLEQIEKFIYEKIDLYRKSSTVSDDAIPPCSEHERWARKPVYAVKKTGRKTAVKLCDSKDEAEFLAQQLGTNHFVEYRPGESIRCRSYCLCSQFCSFYNEVVLKQATDNAA